MIREIKAKIKTPPAAMSLIFPTIGCWFGCEKSMIFSITELKTSAVNTLPIAKRTKAHSVGDKFNNNPSKIALAAAIIWIFG